MEMKWLNGRRIDKNTQYTVMDTGCLQTILICSCQKQEIQDSIEKRISGGLQGEIWLMYVDMRE